MKLFNFNDPTRWNFKGVVYLYEPTSEEGADMVACIFEDIEAYNNAAPGETMMYDREKAHKLATEGSRFDLKGTCDHCGAHFHYGALYESHDGEVAVVGNQCATNKLNLTAHQYQAQRLQAIVDRARTKAKGNSRMAALASNRREALEHKHEINRDMRSRFRKYGSLSVKQWALAKKIRRESLEREARFEEERENAKPVIEGNGLTIEGEVLTTKWQSDFYGETLKMLVRDDRGFKVWGTMPASLNVERGARVRFIANVEASKDDETFGFFKRPRKAEELVEEVA